MKIRPDRLIESMTGSPKGSQLTTYQRGPVIVGRARVVPRNPRTADQRTVRDKGMLGDAWASLAPEVRAAWQAWAIQWAQTNRISGKPVLASGWNAFSSAAEKRLRMGLPVPEDVPLPLPRPQILGCTEVGTGLPDSFAFLVERAPVPAGGLTVLPEIAIAARITPPSPRASRTPYPENLRSISFIGPQSFRLLPADPAEPVVFEGARFQVHSGQRFGFELTPVRVDDGVAGAPVWGEAFRA